MASVAQHAPVATTLRARRGGNRNHALIAGAAILVLLVLLALLAPLLARFSPEVANPAVSLRPPGASHWLGTDSAGFDIYSRVLYGARTDRSSGWSARSSRWDSAGSSAWRSARSAESSMPS
jgi:ABC-type dipeptide/oligopeptide/nickel transport system permease subunit